MGNKKSRNKPQEAAALPQRQGTAGGHYNNHKEKPKQRFWRDYEPIEKFNLIIATFTILSVLVAGGLYWTGRGALGIARDTLRIESRAFVFASEVGFRAAVDAGAPIPDSLQNTPPIIDVVLKNAGPTVARSVALYTGACLKKGTLPDDFAYPVNATKQTLQLIPPTTEGPGTSINITLAQLHTLVTSPEYNLYVWGDIEYTDVFDIPHTFLACTFCI